ncbi:MAG: hypothetical protein ACOC2Y_01445 [Spirochaetota bacterium]
MNHLDELFGCEQRLRALVRRTEAVESAHAGDANPDQPILMRRYRRQIETELAEAQMVYERYVAETPSALRETERQRLETLLPVFTALKRRYDPSGDDATRLLRARDEA